MSSKALENVKNQIGCCGIWCGSCIVGNGTLRELTKRYEHLISGYGIDEWGAKGFDSKEFMKGLSSLQKLPICVGSRKGGGNEQCRIRPCTSKKKVSDCSECVEIKTCKNSEALRKVRTGALAVGMVARSGKGNQQTLIKKWTAEEKGRFPFFLIDI